MNIAVDISPIEESSNSQHKVRGVGKYITLLRENLERFDKVNTYSFTTNPSLTTSSIIHYPYFDPFFISLPIKKKRKTIVTIHDVIPLIHSREFPVGAKGTIKWKLNKLLLRAVDGIITDSNASKEDIVKVTGIESSRIHPVYLSADDFFNKMDVTKSEKERVVAKYKLPEKFFLYVGDVTWNKNLPRLIAAIKKVNVPLVMVGKALADLDFDQQHVWNKDRMTVNEKTQNDPLFRKLGFVPNEELATLYNLALALAMPSLDEGFGLPVLEAMQSGCPVVTTKEGSLPEVAGEAAIYVEAHSEKDIERGLGSILRDEEMRSQFSHKGLAQAANFSLEKMIADTVRVYESIANETKN